VTSHQFLCVAKAQTFTQMYNNLQKTFGTAMATVVIQGMIQRYTKTFLRIVYLYERIAFYEWTIYHCL